MQASEFAMKLSAAMLKIADERDNALQAFTWREAAVLVHRMAADAGIKLPDEIPPTAEQPEPPPPVATLTIGQRVQLLDMAVRVYARVPDFKGIICDFDIGEIFTQFCHLVLTESEPCQTPKES